MRYEILKFHRIRDIRNDKGYSQKEIASKLTIAQNTLSQYETGERNIPNDILVEMAILYETSVDYLLGLTDEKTPYKRTSKISLTISTGLNMKAKVKMRTEKLK